MFFSTVASILAGAALVTAAPQAETNGDGYVVVKEVKVVYKDCSIISPKVLIMSTFANEAQAWYDGVPGNTIGNLQAINVTVPGLSPINPVVYCTADQTVCQITLGEGSINAASSVMALAFSNLFDFTSTYIFIAGIAGVNPAVGTTGTVAFSRYTVQGDLQFELDARQKPENFSTGYWGQGSLAPGDYSQSLYGTEVFELNQPLRDLAMKYASTVTLNDTTDAIQFREFFANSTIYAAAAKPPSVIACDVVSSNVFWSGSLLGDSFSNYTKLLTNGSGIYCMSVQEDSGILEALLRGALAQVVDFARVIHMRTASDFDRAPPGSGISEYDELVLGPSGGFNSAINNIAIAGTAVVEGILANWDATFSQGINATNYIGDIFASGGGNPDFGPGPLAVGSDPAGFLNQ